jgi:Bacterial regulatory proteins, gntR family
VPSASNPPTRGTSYGPCHLRCPARRHRAHLPHRPPDYTIWTEDCTDQHLHKTITAAASRPYTARIDPDDERPKYRQIAGQLRDAIRAGVITDRLPSETQLRATYGVGRMTVRQAVQVLILEGLVHARHGVGVLVNHPEEENPDV